MINTNIIKILIDNSLNKINENNDNTLEERFVSDQQRKLFYALSKKKGKVGRKFRKLTKEFEKMTPKGIDLPYKVKPKVKMKKKKKDNKRKLNEFDTADFPDISDDSIDYNMLPDSIELELDENEDGDDFDGHDNVIDDYGNHIYPQIDGYGRDEIRSSSSTRIKRR